MTPATECIFKVLFRSAVFSIFIPKTETEMLPTWQYFGSYEGIIDVVNEFSWTRMKYHILKSEIDGDKEGSQ